MDQATLAACNAKFDRANERFQQLDIEWRSWLDTNPYPGWVKVDSQTGWHHLFYDFSIPAPPYLSVIAGEMAHDLRSLLDHLAWREVVEHKGLGFAECNSAAIMFPVTRTRHRRGKKKRPPGFDELPIGRWVSKDAWTIMEEHQPWRRVTNHRPLTLALLHWFNRIDKHRLVHPAATFVTFVPLTHLIEYRREIARVIATDMCAPLHRPLRGQTEFGRIRFDLTKGDPQVCVKRTPSLSISFGEAPDPLRGLSMPETFEEVRRVIDAFADLIP